jgi:cob(I)alamin adenosyltransferase
MIIRAISLSVTNYNIPMKNKFYTTTGDDGYSGLLGEGRVPKHHPRIELIGAIDEATSSLGLARALCSVPESGTLLLNVQRDLYHMMAEAAATPENAHQFRAIDESKVKWIEEQIDLLSNKVEVPEGFIVPGDSPAGAALAIARTVVRRAERHLAKLWFKADIENQNLLRYLNRLSSLCFVLELVENDVAGKGDTTYAKAG